MIGRGETSGERKHRAKKARRRLFCQHVAKPGARRTGAARFSGAALYHVCAHDRSGHGFQAVFLRPGRLRQPVFGD